MVENVAMISVGQLHEFDIGQLEEVIPTPNEINTAARLIHLQHPVNFPHEEKGRDWLVIIIIIKTLFQEGDTLQ